MSDIETKLGAILANQENMSEDIHTIRRTMEGNGDPDSGMIVRVDRMYQAFLSEKREKSNFKTLLVGAIIGFVANAGLFVVQLLAR